MMYSLPRLEVMEIRLVQLLCIWLVILIGGNIPAIRAGPNPGLANMHQSRLNFMQVQAASQSRVATVTNYNSNLVTSISVIISL
jgi:hypothetical protein